MARLMQAGVDDDENDNNWKLQAMRVRGVIHFNMFWKNEKQYRAEKQNASLSNKERYGAKFEHYLLSGATFVEFRVRFCWVLSSSLIKISCKKSKFSVRSILALFLALTQCNNV